MKRMKLLASGDLSQEPLKSNLKDEIGQLVDSTNVATKNTLELLSQIKYVSVTTSTHSEELTQAANEVSAGTQQIAAAMQELATGTETQANSTSELSTMVGEFSKSVQDVNQHGEHIKRKYGKRISHDK